MMGSDGHPGLRTACPKAAARAQMIAAQRESGVFIVHSGDGKGKSTAAFGLLARALGHGMRAGVVQFSGAGTETGEAAFFRHQPGVIWHTLATAGECAPEGGAGKAGLVLRAWERAVALLRDPAIGVVILDELNIALRDGFLDAAAVLQHIAARPPMQHVVVTGRAALPQLVDAADTVTDMGLVKHGFSAGIRAMPGVEY